MLIKLICLIIAGGIGTYVFMREIKKNNRFMNIEPRKKYNLSDLDIAYNHFNNASTPEEVDIACYEIKTESMRMDEYLKQKKKEWNKLFNCEFQEEYFINKYKGDDIDE